MSTRFSGVLKRKSAVEEEPAPAEPQAAAAPVAEVREPAVAPEPVRMGRPKGKKSSDDYIQVTVYLRKETHLAAKKILIDDRRQFSDLVESLVTHWITNPKG